MKIENLILYSSLRRELDPRPKWMQTIGIHGILLNGAEIRNPYPRLKYKRKDGSFCVHKFAEDSYKSKEESKYDSYLEELKEDMNI